jgi:hypothetical protein
MNNFRGAAVNSSTLLSTVTVIKYLISLIFGSHNETTGVWASTRGVSEGDRPDAAGEIV